jgi:hypothetical protein
MNQDSCAPKKIIIYDSTIFIPTIKPCSTLNKVICTDCDEDSDCISIISDSTVSSFDSIDDNDQLLQHEIQRARVLYKKSLN